MGGGLTCLNTFFLKVLQVVFSNSQITITKYQSTTMSKTAYFEDDVQDPRNDVLVLHQQVFSLLLCINKYDCAPVALLFV